jgi:hypothetical protein
MHNPWMQSILVIIHNGKRGLIKMNLRLKCTAYPMLLLPSLFGCANRQRITADTPLGARHSA